MLRCEFDVLETDRPYPAVPRVGEHVIPNDDNMAGRTLHAREVRRVIYANDGTVILDWEVDALINDPEPQIAALLEAGYVEKPVLQRE